MSVLKEYWIKCDQCGTIFYFADSTVGKVRAEAKSRGWVSKRGKKDFCDRCAKRQRQSTVKTPKVVCPVCHEGVSCVPARYVPTAGGDKNATATFIRAHKFQGERCGGSGKGPIFWASLTFEKGDAYQDLSATERKAGGYE